MMARASAPGSSSKLIFPGMWITKNVVLHERIGMGGMGSVWRAEHMPLGIEVAVKFMAPELLDDEISYERFRREARSAAQIHSAHVVKVLDHGTTDEGFPYIVMELLEGETLSARLKRKQRLTLQEAEWIVRDVCRGLASAHSQSIIHRDIKPANLFLAQQHGRTLVKLLDFGVSHTIARDTRLTQTGTIVGSPKYMSPEQLMAPSDVDARADLWGLAAVTYRVLTGRTPFPGDNVATIAVALNRGEHVAASVLNPELPTAIDRWFYKAFERYIEDRFENAEQMEQLFRHLLRGETEDDLETVSLHIDMVDLPHSLQPETQTLIKRPSGPKGSWQHTQRMSSLNASAVAVEALDTEVTHNRFDEAETEDIMPTHRVRKMPHIPPQVPVPVAPPDSRKPPRAPAADSDGTTRVMRERRQPHHHGTPPSTPASQAPQGKPGAQLLAERARKQRQFATFVVLVIIVITLLLALFFALVF